MSAVTPTTQGSAAPYDPANQVQLAIDAEAALKKPGNKSIDELQKAILNGLKVYRSVFFNKEFSFGRNEQLDEEEELLRMDLNEAIQAVASQLSPDVKNLGRRAPFLALILEISTLTKFLSPTSAVPAPASNTNNGSTASAGAPAPAVAHSTAASAGAGTTSAAASAASDSASSSAPAGSSASKNEKTT
jgi:hypothetical protein